MTQQAKLVIGPEALAPLVSEWSQVGLLGEFAWLDAEAVGTGLSSAAWQTVEARIMTPGVGCVPQRLMEYLSMREGVSSVLALWLRPPEEALAPGLQDAEAFLQRVFPRVMARVRIDLINPCELGQADIPEPVQGWEQFVIATQDNPELSQPDSGWSLTKDAAAVHTLAALAGVLGGVTVVEPLGSANKPRFVHVFSRHVTGGRNARIEATHYQDDKLPRFDASDIVPQRYGRPLKPTEMVDDCITWLESAHSGGLSYAEPQPSLINEIPPAPRLPYAAWGEAVRQMFMGEPSPALARAAAVIAKEAAGLTTELETAAKKEGDRPHADVWKAAFQLVTGIVDGGTVPSGYTRPVWTDQELVLSPADVDPNPGYELSDYPMALIEEYPQFQVGPPVQIADSAVSEAVERLDGGSSPFAWRSEEDGTATSEAKDSRRKRVSDNKAIPTSFIEGPPPGTPPRDPLGAAAAASVNRSDQVARQRQAEGLAARWRAALPADSETSGEEGDKSQHAVDPGPPTSLIDRLFRDLVRDSLKARADGARWHELALRLWKPALGMARRWAWTLASLGTAIIGAWSWVWNYYDFPDPVTWLNDPIGYALGWFVGLPLILGGVGFLASAIRHQYATAHYQRALRRLLGERALTAYAEAGRLDHAVRIFGQWWSIYRELHRGAPADPPEELPPVPALPASLQTGDPSVHINFQALKLAKAATEIGWRSAMVRSLNATCMSRYDDQVFEDPLGALMADRGLVEGALFRLARDLASGAIWTDWRRAEIERVTGRILDGLVAPATRIDSQSGQTVSEFLAEVLAAPGITPGIHQGVPHQAAVEFFLGVTPNASQAARGLQTQHLTGTWLTGASAVHVAWADVPTRPDPREDEEPHPESDPDDPL